MLPVKASWSKFIIRQFKKNHISGWCRTLWPLCQSSKIRTHKNVCYDLFLVITCYSVILILLEYSCKTIISDRAILKQNFTQYPSIHTNYSWSNCTISNKKDFNRRSDFLVIINKGGFILSKMKFINILPKWPFRIFGMLYYVGIHFQKV